MYLIYSIQLNSAIKFNLIPQSKWSTRSQVDITVEEIFKLVRHLIKSDNMYFHDLKSHGKVTQTNILSVPQCQQHSMFPLPCPVAHNIMKTKSVFFFK